MESVRLLDTREGVALERAATSYLDTLRPTVLKVIQQSARLPPPDTSSWLGRVDAMTTPFETSQIARTFALVAADNIRQTERVLRRDLPPFALYSMIRSAIEASSLGLWVLDAKSDQLSASRTLRIYRQNIASDRTMWNEFVGRPSDDHNTLAREAHRAHDRLRGISSTDYEKAVRSSSVIGVVDQVHPVAESQRTSISGLEAWRICSSIVHANSVSMTHILERHPDEEVGQPATRTSRLSFVASFLATACVRAEELIDLYRERARPRRARKSSGVPHDQPSKETFTKD